MCNNQWGWIVWYILHIQWIIFQFLNIYFLKYLSTSEKESMYFCKVQKWQAHSACLPIILVCFCINRYPQTQYLRFKPRRPLHISDKMATKLISNQHDFKVVPESYILPPGVRPGTTDVSVMEVIPVIDLQHLATNRSQVVKQIIEASQEYGFFQVWNTCNVKFLFHDFIWARICLLCYCVMGEMWVSNCSWSIMGLETMCCVRYWRWLMSSLSCLVKIKHLCILKILSKNLEFTPALTITMRRCISGETLWDTLAIL